MSTTAKQTTDESRLEALKLSVERCREGRVRAKFPDQLKWQIVEQIPYYSLTDLSHRVGVPISTLTRWRRFFALNDINLREDAAQFVDPSSSSFVQLPASVSPEQSNIEDSQRIPVIIELGTEQHPGQYRLEAQVDVALFQQLLQRIAGALVR